MATRGRDPPGPPHPSTSTPLKLSAPPSCCPTGPEVTQGLLPVQGMRRSIPGQVDKALPAQCGHRRPREILGLVVLQRADQMDTATSSCGVGVRDAETWLLIWPQLGLPGIILEMGHRCPTAISSSDPETTQLCFPRVVTVPKLGQAALVPTGLTQGCTPLAVSDPEALSGQGPRRGEDGGRGGRDHVRVYTGTLIVLLGGGHGSG